MGEQETAQHTLMRKALAPFVMGERSCAGKPMAWMEMTLTLARVIWGFDFERAPGKAGEVGEKLCLVDGKLIPVYRAKDIYVTEHDGPNLVFSVRADVAEEHYLEIH
ncbi:hypothetical protein QQS21_006921 [Conoideocrella luteorostrata]|uniref:Cytochrome P450 n=1 Tax=Conoideocrella luteorostrata TaxID=1105319 RepID=A0AAJ0CLQ4_9HYPO|nr:hypothetical protein QQS21_006921 [Conoideocrella luteorostrata]